MLMVSVSRFFYLLRALQFPCFCFPTGNSDKIEMHIQQRLIRQKARKLGELLISLTQLNGCWCSWSLLPCPNLSTRNGLFPQSSLLWVFTSSPLQLSSKFRD